MQALGLNVVKVQTPNLGMHLGLFSLLLCPIPVCPFDSDSLSLQTRAKVGLF